MNTIERRTTGQPSYYGLTEGQFRFFLSGYFLLMAAVTFAMFIFAPIGLAIIAAASFFLGYFCRSDKRLKFVSSRMGEFELDLLTNGILAFVGIGCVAIAYIFDQPNHLSYRLLIMATCWFVHKSALTAGEYIRACWNGFRI